MGLLEELRELYAFNRWANARVLDSVEALTEAELTKNLGSSFPSVRATIVHLLAAEWIWISRWHGMSPRAMPDEWAESTLQELRDHWTEVEEQQELFLRGVRESDLDRVIRYHDISGEPHASSIRQMLRHVVNHASFHRGQVVTMLRQLGKPAPSTDLMLYFRSTPPPRS